MRGQLKFYKDRFDELVKKLALVERAMEHGSDKSLLTAALRVINRHNLTDEFVDELTTQIRRKAIAADFGFVEQGADA